ncbi:hypothetical protein DFH09DRAFT_1402638 [Mycena vulgaris]|nr:hypothetical protein DFH09DRAFT_1402638 [Mycena vulgaris]
MKALMTEFHLPMSPAAHNMDVVSHRDPRIVLTASSSSTDWLPNMILAAKTMVAGTELIPLPFIRAAFGTVVIFLETVDKIKRNRGDLKDLCASTMEIILILRDEITAHGEIGAVRSLGLCENFISFIQSLQDGLEKLRRRQGIRGKLQEVLGAARIVDQILRYRTRIQEPRSNFMLMATISTNLPVNGLQKDFSELQISRSLSSTTTFRNIPLGDINLQYETATGKMHNIKIFAARISGEPSTMTVVKYEDEAAASLTIEDKYTSLTLLIEIGQRVQTIFKLKTS